MRKFKHILTNREFITQLLGHNKVEGIEWGSWHIPMWVVENSNDWEEIKEKILTTIDGVDLYEGDEVYTVFDSFSVGFTSFLTKDYLKFGKIRAFSTYEAAQKWIKEQNSYTTTDGQIIKEGDTFYIYDDIKFKCIETCYGHYKNSKFDGKRFRNKETVERLIKLNKPQYNVLDIVKFVNDIPEGSVSEEKVIEYFKNKYNGN